MDFQEFQKRYNYNTSTDRLGGGGFGEVFKAYDTHRDRWVAIKIAKVIPELESIRLKKEVELVSQLPTHPNIAYYEECYTFSSFDGEYDFGILQYYEQGNLLQLLNKSTLLLEQKQSVLHQILYGLDFLHKNGIIHRDLKPQNILIVKRGNEYIPKITDFGISKKLDANKSSIFSNSLVGAGTLAYSSPEQLADKIIRKNTDLWSFGIISFQVFTGQLPFSTGNHGNTSEAGRQELFRQINSGELSEKIYTIEERWQKLISACLIPDADKRVKECTDCIDIIKNKIFTKNNSISELTSEERTLLDIQQSCNTKTDETNVLPIFSTSGNHSNKLIKKKKKRRKWIIGILSSILFILIAIIILLSYDRIPISRNGKYGYKNGLGITVIPYKYDYADSFFADIAKVQLNKKWGFINQSGEIIIPIKYDYANTFFKNDDLVYVKLNEKWGFIDKNGNTIIPHKYDEACSFDRNGLANVMLNEKWGVIDKNGNTIIPHKYDGIGSFSEGLLAVGLNGIWGYIDESDNYIISPKYHTADEFNKGLARVIINDKWGIIDKAGTTIIPCQYDLFITEEFKNGLIPACLNKKWGYIDKDNNIIIPFKYDHADKFYNDNIAYVKLNNTYLYIDKQGNEYTDFKEAVKAAKNIVSP